MQFYRAKNFFKNEAFWKAAKQGHCEILQLLLKYSRVDPSDQYNIVIREAIQNGMTLSKYYLRLI